MMKTLMEAAAITGRPLYEEAEYESLDRGSLWNTVLLALGSLRRGWAYKQATADAVVFYTDTEKQAETESMV